MRKSLLVTDRSQIITLIYMIIIFLCLISAWEGFKWIGKSNDYRLDVGITNLNLNMTRDVNMPHLRAILDSYSQPAQRNGPPLIEVLLEAAGNTALRAVTGFLMGTTLGLVLAIIFVHFRILERGLMPFVVASQTVPILAIAPMVVIWASRADIRSLGVPIIAAYLAFFPVTIYTLRGLADVPQTALELMQSYAASPLQILWKLRLPNAVPYIFTALKITAPASVVGAVIGELPSGIQNGLGGAIINYAQYYTSSPPKLWATNLITALLGIAFYVTIALLEKLVVRWKSDDTQR